MALLRRLPSTGTLMVRHPTLTLAAICASSLPRRRAVRGRRRFGRFRVIRRQLPIGCRAILRRNVFPVPGKRRGYFAVQRTLKGAIVDVTVKPGVFVWRRPTHHVEVFITHPGMVQDSVHFIRVVRVRYDWRVRRCAAGRSARCPAAPYGALRCRWSLRWYDCFRWSPSSFDGSAGIWLS